MGKKTYIYGIGIIVLIGILYFLLSGNKASSFQTLNNYDGGIKMYKSLSCGCCEAYSSYFKGKGNSNIQIIDINDIELIKNQNGVPEQLESCHTVIIGDYFVEGHVPLEAVEKLLVEKPDIKGIALPGMPEGSPGMLGNKQEDFVIYAVNYDGSYQEFVRL